MGVLRALKALRLAGGLLRKEKEAGPPQAGSDWDQRLTTHIKTTSPPSSPRYSSSTVFEQSSFEGNPL